MHVSTRQLSDDTSTDARGLVAAFARALHGETRGPVVRELAETYIDRAAARLCRPDDRPVLARTLVKLIHMLRSAGWVDAALRPSAFAIESGIIDEHILSETAECWLALGRFDEAEAIVEQAIALGSRTDALRNSLIRSYGRVGRLSDALRVFESAEADGCDAYTYATLIGAYARQGDLPGAQVAFDRAVNTGNVSTAVYAAYASAVARAGTFMQLMQVLEAASSAQLRSSRLTSALIRGCVRFRRFRDARVLLESQKRDGYIEASTYSTLIRGCHRAGRHREAKRILRAALEDPTIKADAWRILAADRCHRDLADAEPPATDDE